MSINLVKPGNNSANSGYSAHMAHITGSQNARPPIQGNNPLQQGVKCPHGYPGGCPICLGKTGGGGGGGNDTKKRVGMSWGEAYYVYNMIQKNKMNAREDKHLSEMARQRLQMLEKLQSTGLYQAFIALKNRAVELTAKLKTAVLHAGMAIDRAVVKPALETVNRVINTLNQTVAKLAGVINKLTAMIGERLKITAETVRDNIRKMIARLRETEFLSRLMAVFNDKRHLFQDLLLRKIESLKEKIEKFTNIISFLSGEEPDKKGKKKNRVKNKKKKLKRVSEVTC